MESPEAPKAPPFFPINVAETIAQALEYDTAGFDWSDQDFVSRFPGLVATRNEEIDRAYDALNGPLNPDIQSMFARGGLMAGLNTVGGGDPMSGLGMTEGSFGRNVAGATMTKSLLEKQDYDRLYFDQLIGNNPQRAFGISGSDVASLGIANTGNLNASNQAQYQATLAGIYGAGQSASATGTQVASLGNLLASLGRGY